MTNDDIIRMAVKTYWDAIKRFNDVDPMCVDHSSEFYDNAAVAEVALAVAASERERLKWDGIHSCYPECDRPACVNTRKAVEAEREECAKICDELQAGLRKTTMKQHQHYLDGNRRGISECAFAIRARRSDAKS